MLLGIVIHSALSYNLTDFGEAWPIRDPNARHIFADSIVFFINTFRMPIFFFLAGYFAVLLLQNRGLKKLIHNRFARIVLPFLIFWILLWPMINFSFCFSESFLSSGKDFSDVFTECRLLEYSFLPNSTFHLWFLYYLIFFTCLSVIITLMIGLLNVSLKTRFLNGSKAMIENSLGRVALFTSVIFLILFSLKTSKVEPSIRLTLDSCTFIFYFCFYILGWLVRKSEVSIHSFKKNAWFNFLIAIALLSVHGMLIIQLELPHNAYRLDFIFLSAVEISLFIFGITGLFIRYMSKRSTLMRYLSDSSYWVYLIHLPITAFIPSLFRDWPIPGILKLTLVICLTSIICFFTYHYLVRNSFIGKFLNGRKYATFDSLSNQTNP